MTSARQSEPATSESDDWCDLLVETTSQAGASRVRSRLKSPTSQVEDRPKQSRVSSQALQTEMKRQPKVKGGDHIKRRGDHVRHEQARIEEPVQKKGSHPTKQPNKSRKLAPAESANRATTLKPRHLPQNYREQEVIFATAIQEARKIRDLRTELASARSSPLLDKEWAKAAGFDDVLMLHHRLRAGQAARSALVEMHAPLVKSVCRKYAPSLVKTGGLVQYSDLYQEATLGLIRAAEL